MYSAYGYYSDSKKIIESYTNVNIDSNINELNITNIINVNWYNVASSSDAKYLFAIGPRSGIYISTNLGKMWSILIADTTLDWIGITCSKTGINLVACAIYGGIYYSNNFGLTWKKSDAPENIGWFSVASDESGQYLIACASNEGLIYTSSNYGVTWLKNNKISIMRYISVAINIKDNKDKNNKNNKNNKDNKNNNITYIVGGDNTGIIISNDSGKSWETKSIISNWESFDIDSTGTKMVASSGYIYISDDTGVTWTQLLNAPMCYQVISDKTGNILVGCSKGKFHKSTNRGNTWKTYSIDDTTSFSSIAMDQTGKIITLAAMNNQSKKSLFTAIIN